MIQKKASASRKTNLVEFQRRLNEQLEANLSSDRVLSWMAFSAAQTNWLINIGDTREIAPYPDSSFRFDVTKNWVLGIGNFRGNIHTMVDFSLFLGGAPSQINMNTRALLVHNKFDTNIALVVPQVFGLKKMDSLTRKPGAQKSSVWVNEVFEDDKGVKWEFLDVQGLVSSREMMEVEAA